MEILAVLFWLWVILAIFSSKDKRKERLLDAASYKPEMLDKSHFATEKEMDAVGLFGPGGIEIGQSKQSGRTVRFHAEVRPHMAYFGGSGVGKSSELKRIEVTFNGSLFIFDSTAEHAIETSHYRQSLGPCYMYNPHGIHASRLRHLKSVRLNWLGPHWMDPASSLLDSRANDIAASQVSKVEGHNKFFYDTPRDFYTSIILAQILHGKPADRNLPYITRQIINNDLRGYARHIYRITNDANLRARLQRLVEDSDLRSMPECIETLRTETGWMLNAAIADSLSAADITFSQFRRRPQTLYIILPLEIKTLGPLNKLILGMILAELFQGEAIGDIPVLVIMDELYQYGKDLEALPAAFGAARKFGVGLLGCMTSVSEAQILFPNDFAVIMANLGMARFLDAYDEAGCKLVSSLLGNKNVNSFQKNLSYDPARFRIEPFAGNSKTAKVTGATPSWADLQKLHISQTYGQQARPLLTPTEIRQELGLREEITFIRECPYPLRLNRVPIYETALARRLKPSPFYRGKKNQWGGN